MPKKYVVRLSPEERERLQDLVSKGKTQAYRSGTVTSFSSPIDRDGLQ